MYILMLLLWSVTANSSHYVAITEFSSKEACEIAGQAATKKFSGYGVHPYYVCTPK